eukprot:4471644-Alexandrium_andersonii.AAC.1
MVNDAPALRMLTSSEVGRVCRPQEQIQHLSAVRGDVGGGRRGCALWMTRLSDNHCATTVRNLSVAPAGRIAKASATIAETSSGTNPNTFPCPSTEAEKVATPGQ